MSCGVGCKCGSDLQLLWLWHRPETTALMGPLAWELPCDAGAALEKTKEKKKGPYGWVSWDSRRHTGTPGPGACAEELTCSCCHLGHRAAWPKVLDLVSRDDLAPGQSPHGGNPGSWWGLEQLAAVGSEDSESQRTILYPGGLSSLHSVLQNHQGRTGQFSYFNSFSAWEVLPDV